MSLKDQLDIEHRNTAGLDNTIIKDKTLTLPWIMELKNSDTLTNIILDIWYSQWQIQQYLNVHIMLLTQKSKLHDVFFYTTLIFYSNVKIWAEASEIFQLWTQKFFLFLSIPRALNIIDFLSINTKIHLKRTN